MNLGSTRISVLLAVFACLVLAAAWSGMSMAGPSTDTDGDTVLDYQDNCTTTSNTTQADTNSDGYGNACDADYDNDGVVGQTDFAMFRVSYGSCVTDGGYDPATDSNADDCTGMADFSVLFDTWGQAPGPSAADR